MIAIPGCALLPGGEQMHRSASGEAAGAVAWRRQDWAVALVLFLATATVVVWQNSRLGVLWDLSYILENAYRISLGDIPYRDFPFPFAPLTFLLQAALIKLTGRVFFHHVLYCAVVGGAATVLTWRILLNLLQEAVVSARLVAFLLSAPLTVLGIYCIFPHPFYDPDCTFAILLGVLLLQQLESRGFPPQRAVLTGVVLIVPLFVKQNIGLAFLGGIGLALGTLLGLDSWYRQPVRRYLWLIAGMVAGLVAALLLIQFTAGLADYRHWTLQFAMSRRLPSRADMLSIYQEDDNLPWWLAAFAAGVVLLWLSRRDRRAWALLAAGLMTIPFLWPLISLFTAADPLEPGDRLLALWPFLLLVSGGVALWRLWRERRHAGITQVLPFIVIGAVHGALLSQQVWGSTYGLWPLLMFLIASTLATLMSVPQQQPAGGVAPFAAILTVSLLVCGGHYVWKHERLNYARLSGAMVRPTLPALAGLSIRGPWIRDFEELVRFAERHIPEQDGLLMIPGEDLFYYTTGRRPRFPVVMFDHTINPYSPAEILALSQSRGIRWLVLKRRLQLDDEPVENKTRLLALLRREFTPVARLKNYDIYRRK